MQIQCEFALVMASHGYYLWVHMNEHKLANNVMQLSICKYKLSLFLSTKDPFIRVVVNDGDTSTRHSLLVKGAPGIFDLCFDSTTIKFGGFINYIGGFEDVQKCVTN